MKSKLVAIGMCALLLFLPGCSPSPASTAEVTTKEVTYSGMTRDQASWLQAVTQTTMESNGYEKHGTSALLEDWTMSMNEWPGASMYTAVTKSSLHGSIKMTYAWDGDTEIMPTLAYMLIDGDELLNNLDKYR